MTRAIHGHIRQLAGAIAAHALADHEARLEVEHLGNDRYNRATACAHAIAGIVVASRTAAEPTGDPEQFVVAKTRISRDLGNDIRTRIDGEVAAGGARARAV